MGSRSAVDHNRPGEVATIIRFDERIGDSKIWGLVLTADVQGYSWTWLPQCILSTIIVDNFTEARDWILLWWQKRLVGVGKMLFLKIVINDRLRHRR